MGRILVLLILFETPFVWANEPAERVVPDERTPFHHIESALTVGNKGEEEIDVSVDGQCGETVWVFDHAELQVVRSRFGDAQFVRLPPAGCRLCEPVLVRWYHEPTGYLKFNVNVYRREQKLVCDKRTERDADKEQAHD